MDIDLSGEQATETLAAFASSTGYDELPELVRHEAKRLTLDVIGNIIGGVQSELGAIALRFVDRYGGAGRNTIIATNRRVPTPIAAYANARIGDALDSVDTQMAVYHLGGPIVSSALTVAEVSGASGKTVLAAVAVGMEVAARIASSVGPPSFMSRVKAGEHREARGRMPAPELGSSVAAARVLGLDSAGACYALGIAGANAPIHATRWGEPEVLPYMKYADNGVCAQTGVTAALQADSGMTSHPGVLDGERGLWALRGAPGCDFGVMLGGLGEKWLLLDNTYKPWTSCRWTHHALTLFERILAEHPLRPDEIEGITVHAHPWVMGAYMRDQEPRGMVSCEFNQPHTLAMMAFGIPPGPWWYEEKTRNDPRIAEFRRKISVELEPESIEAEKWYVDGQIRRLPNRLSVYARGQVFEAKGDYAKGDPWSEETYFTDEALHRKFLYMGSREGENDRAWAGRAGRISEAVEALDRAPNTEGLMGLLRF